MRNPVGGDNAAAEQLVVLRMLRLSARRSAVAELRAEQAANVSFPKSHPSSSNTQAERKAIAEEEEDENFTVVGAVRCPSGEASPKKDSCNAHRPLSSTSNSVAHEPTHLIVEVPRSYSDTPTEKENTSTREKKAEVKVEEEASLVPVSSTSSTAASPPSPLSPMRRMMAMKGVRPMQPPRSRDVVPPHRSRLNIRNSTSINNGDNDILTPLSREGSSGEGGGGDAGLPSGSSGSASRGSRVEAAKASLQQQVVHRSLSSLGLPVWTGVSVAVQRRRGTTLLEDSPTVPMNAGRAAFPLTDGLDRAERGAVTLTVPHGEGGGTANGKDSVDVSKQDTPLNGISTAAATATTLSPVAAVSSLLDLADVDDDGGGRDGLTSPIETRSFAEFIQRLYTAPLPPAPTPLNYDTDSGRAPATTTPVKADVGGMPCRTVQHFTPLTGAGSLAATSPGASEKSLTASSSLAQPFLILTSPPPYAEAAPQHASLGAGTFTTAQQLIAHARLTQRWTIAASRRWYRSNTDSTDKENNSNAATPLSCADLLLQQQRQPSSLMGCKPSASSSKSAAAAAMRSPFVQDGDSTLVSDRVDAVLPTWAFLASHIATAPLMSPLAGQPLGPAAESTASLSLSSPPASRRTRQSRNSSFCSSATSAAARDNESWTKEGRFDRQSCLFPYDLAEACALGRLRRGSPPPRSGEVGVAEGAAASSSSLHLLRLEFLVDVQPLPPAVCNASSAARQALLEQALEDFAESGVLPTTVLRSVLNDAALRLLCSVDNAVLRRIARDGVAGAKAHNGIEGTTTTPLSADAVVAATGSEPTAAPWRAEAVPLSLHVHTVQGDLSTAALSSAHSAAASTISEDADSLWPVSVTAASAAPTQLIITVLTHVSRTPLSPAVDDERENQSECPAASTHPNNAGHHAMTADTALALAQAVLVHLFPVSFALSYHTTRLSVSSVVDYDALCKVPDKPAAEHLENANGETNPPPASATAPRPWTWVDVDLTELRAACGVAERPPPLSNLHAVEEPLAAHDVGGAFHGLPRSDSPVASRTKTRTRRSKKTSAASSNATAPPADGMPATTTAAANGIHPHQTHALQDAPPAGETPHLEGGAEVQTTSEETDEESVDVAGVSEGQLRWDVDEETRELTTAAEAMQHQLGLICRCTEVLRQFVEGQEDVKEAPQGSAKAQKTRKGRARAAVARLKMAGRPSYAEELCDTIKTTTAGTTALLIDATPYCALSRAKADDLVAAEDEKGEDSRSLPTTLRDDAASKAGEPYAAQGGSGSVRPLPSLDAPHTLWSSWFEPFADYLSREVCDPLEQLEALILESTSSTVASPVAATVVSVSVEEANGSVNDGGAVPTAPRNVVGARVVLGETRRQRRSVAAAARQAQRPGADATRLQTETGNSTKHLGDSAATAAVASADAAFPSPPLLPSLGLARAMVRLCHEMADGRCVSCNSVAQPTRSLEGAIGGSTTAAAADEEKAEGKTRSADGAHVSHPSPLVSFCHAAHHRTLSTASGASARALGSASVAQSLQEHIHAVRDVLHRVQTQLEAERRRWATLPELLPCLAAEWSSVHEIVDEEASTRRQLQLTCATQRRKTSRDAEARLAKDAAIADAEAAAAAAKREEEEVGEEASKAAPPPALSSAEGKGVEAPLPKPTAADQTETAPPAETSVEHGGAAQATTQGPPAVQCPHNTAAPHSAEVTRQASGADEQEAVEAEDSATQAMRGAATVKAMKEADKERVREEPSPPQPPSSTSSPTTPSPATDAALLEEEEEQTTTEAVAATRGLETKTRAGDSSTASVASAQESASSSSAPTTSVRKQAVPQLSLNTSDVAPRTPPRPLQTAPTSSISNRGSSKGSTVATSNEKKLRHRNKQQQQQQQRPNAARISATGTPITTSSAGLRSRTSSSSFAFPSSTTGPSNSSAGVTASASNGNHGAMQVGRQAPQDAFHGLLNLHVDVALLREAAPFIVLGTALFLLFLLL
ncbi:hypothetical protein ABB37_09315 [Leptomonas pyrrhocoris]|uniref:Cysteine peptidase B (CPB) n=1 Tax=Leptomonas pyrrhocoris TaxID=157538 RepID=A0A0N0VD05_LEPPY|nr:hypothetical protein ABB37_09315 [Leptomonas pyrrhocoris]KPA74328.1 hypothetical protein ABB37_09315 [Leptomonas pyrrhocoris]|eukprot:XP_015652767.1 hypothetical protein ABB37_09315 [Leptomonas pyrrhocoris]